MSEQEVPVSGSIETQIKVDLPDPWSGQYAVVRTAISARLAATLDASEDDLVKAIATFETLVVEHNLIDLSGNKAESLLDVDLRAIGHLITKWKDKVSGLPS